MMGFSQQQYRKEQQERKWKINPAWRGIGCVLFLLVPIMAWVAANLVLQSNLNIPLINEMNDIVAIPFMGIQEIDHVILQINHFFQATQFMTGQLLLTAVFMIVGFGVLAFLYSILYAMAGPPRYGPFDVPPNNVK